MGVSSGQRRIRDRATLCQSGPDILQWISPKDPSTSPAGCYHLPSPLEPRDSTHICPMPSLTREGLVSTACCSSDKTIDPAHSSQQACE